jgi:hypothetical protein
VGLGEGTFQKQGVGYGGMRGEADGHPGPPPKTIEGVEEMWRSAAEVIKKKKEMGEWKVPRVVGYEVRCIGEWSLVSKPSYADQINIGHNQEGRLIIWTKKENNW